MVNLKRPPLAIFDRDRAGAIELFPLPPQPRSGDLGRRAGQASGRGNAGRGGGAGRAPLPRRRKFARTNGCWATRSAAMPSLFTRDDSVEAAWRVVDPILGNRHPARRIRARHVGTSGRCGGRCRRRGLARPKARGDAAVLAAGDVVFLPDVDHTLLDNDPVAADLGVHRAHRRSARSRSVGVLIAAPPVRASASEPELAHDSSTNALIRRFSGLREPRR